MCTFVELLSYIVVKESSLIFAPSYALLVPELMYHETKIAT